MSIILALVFRPEEFEEARGVFSNYFEEGNPTGEAPDGMMYNGMEPTLWVDLATVTVPALAGLLAIWLGKGKQVRCERKKGKTKETVVIKNHDGKSTVEILRRFLNDDE